MRFSKLKEISGHSAGIYSLAFDGTFLYSASADKYIARWDIGSGAQDKFAIQFDSPVYSCVLINKGTQLVAALANGHFHIFDLVERKELKFFTQHKVAVFATQENPEKDHLYVGDADGNLSVWDIASLDLLIYLPLGCGKIRRIDVDPTGEFFAVCGQDGFLRVFDTRFFNENCSFKAHEGGVTAALFNPNSPDSIFTGGKDAFLRSWNFRTGELLSSIPAHNFIIYDLLSLNDGRTLLSASRDKTIKIFDLETLSFLQRLDLKEGGHRHSVNCLIKLSENSFASGSDDKRMIIWEEAY
jgi:WD40 repeat protein